MKKLMTLGLLATSFVFAEKGSEITSMMKAPAFEVEAAPVVASYGYYCVGIGPLPAPLVGVGGRYQNGHHGFDGSLQVSTLLLISTVKANANYLYYFYPNLDSQWYMGAGLSWMKVIVPTVRERKLGSVSPQLVVGKQYTNKHGSLRHFQAEIGLNDVYRANFPVSIVFSYGISF
jgi:hypothetical protein